MFSTSYIYLPIKITGHIFRIFDSDGNDFLDFKEFLMAIDVANRETGFIGIKCEL